jgi:hypothetical protein
MSKKAIIELELKADGYKAEIADIQKANTAISDSATKAANQATEAYTQTGKAAKSAFASTEVQKALVTQGAAVDKFTESLSKITPAAKAANQSLEGIDKSVKKLNVDVPKTAKDVAALEDELRQLALEGKQNTEQFNLIAKAIGTFKASITIADRAVDLYAKTTDAATGRIGELEDKLYDLALAGQSNTKEFKDLVKEVANVRRAVIETDAQVDSLAQRGSSIKSFAQSVELVGVAFQAAEGAQALFGTDSEELQKTLVRLNAIMAITSAIEQGRQILLEQITAKTGIAAIATRAYALAVGTSTGALKAFRLALAATGIGLIVIGLIALVQNFDKVKKAFSDFAELKPENTFLKIGKAIVDTALVPINLLIKGIEKVQNLIDPAKEVQKNKGVVEAFIKAEEKRVEARAAAIDRAIALAQAEGKETVNLEIEKEKLFLDFAKRKLKILTDNEKTIAQINKLTGQDLSDFQFDLQQEVLDRENNIKVLRIKNAREVKAAVDELEFKSLERRIKLTKEQEEALKFPTKLLIQSAETQIAILQNVNDTAIELGQNTLSRRIEQIRLEGEARKLAAIRSIDDQDEEATAIQLIEAQTQEAIRAERKRTLDESIQIAQEYVAVVANLASELNELSRINTETSINDINARRDAEIIAINQTLDTERDKIRQREAAELRANKKIGQEKQKQARRDKALALFQAGIDLATSIVKTGATLGYPAAIPFQITAGIVGAAQIAAIASQPIPKFEKGGMIRGKRHRDGGTIVEAEDQEFVVNRGQTRKHLEEVSAINRSTAEFHRLIERKYIQPRIASILSGTNRRSDKVVVNATLNARTMEGELKGLRKDIRRSASKGYKSNQTDTRYQWQRN